jgi:hypothetical protein
VTLRALAGGVVHEVPMVAGWYAAAEDGTVGLYAGVT